MDSDTSNSEVLVHALRPRVAIMNNGTRKGGQPEVMKTLHSSPGLEDLWQIHFSRAQRAGVHRAGNVHRQPARRAVAAMPVAPIPAPQPRAAVRLRRPSTMAPRYWIKVSAQADGSFTVTNARNGFSKSYQAGRQ